MLHWAFGRWTALALHDRRISTAPTYTGEGVAPAAGAHIQPRRVLHMTTVHTFPFVVRGVASCIAALSAFGNTAVDMSAREPFAVAIRLRVDRSISASRFTDRLKTETEAIWGMYGIEFAWSDADDDAPPPSTVSFDVRVERQAEQRRQTEWPTVLGQVVMKPPHPVWRPIHLSLNATERVLAELTSDRPSVGIVLDRDLGRALGRVLAHEIGHVLLDVSDHDRTGLMRAAFRGDFLADPDRRPFRLTCRGVDRLGKRLRELTGDPQAAVQLRSTRLNVEGVDPVSESSRGPSCISTKPAQ